MSCEYVTLRLDAETVTRPFLAEANASLDQTDHAHRRTDHAIAVHRMIVVSSEALRPSLAINLGLRAISRHITSSPVSPRGNAAFARTCPRSTIALLRV